MKLAGRLGYLYKILLILLNQLAWTMSCRKLKLLANGDEYIYNQFFYRIFFYTWKLILRVSSLLKYINFFMACYQTI